MPRFLLLACFFSLALLKAQSGYPSVSGYIEYSYIVDSVSIHNQLAESRENNPEQYAIFAPVMIQATKIAENFDIALNFSATEAISYLNPEALLEKDNSDMAYSIATTIMVSGDKKYYSNSNNKTRLFEVVTGGISIHVTEDYNKYSWKILDQIRQIGDYTCWLAEGFYTKNTSCCGPEQVRLTAWFAPSLSYPYGPMGIDGLPGLILEVTINDRLVSTYRALNVDINTKAKRKVSFLNSPAQVMTFEEYQNAAVEQVKRLRRQ